MCLHGFDHNGKRNIKKTWDLFTPLQYVGADATREVCRRGFDSMKDEFNCDIPVLEIIVGGDISVTGRLSRMRAQGSGKVKVEIWSRGVHGYSGR